MDCYLIVNCQLLFFVRASSFENAMLLLLLLLLLVLLLCLPFHVYKVLNLTNTLDARSRTARVEVSEGLREGYFNATANMAGPGYFANGDVRVINILLNKIKNPFYKNVWPKMLKILKEHAKNMLSNNGEVLFGMMLHKIIETLSF